MMRAVILVGHGGLPTNFPAQALGRLRALQAIRKKTLAEPTAEEVELEATLRHWPRTPATDPYQAGLEALAARIKPKLGDVAFAIAYNEFCAPTLEDAAEQLVDAGARTIVVIPTMMTPGGSHSEIEIPEILDRLRKRHADVTFTYAWPFDLDRVAAMLAEQLERF
jgi:sirohydrochlorin cobaltochelatase